MQDLHQYLIQKIHLKRHAGVANSSIVLKRVKICRPVKCIVPILYHLYRNNRASSSLATLWLVSFMTRNDVCLSIANETSKANNTAAISRWKCKAS